MRIDHLRREFDLNVRWTVFPLHPDTPEDGLELAELFAGRGYDLDAMRERLRQVAADLELPLRERTRTYNSRRAQELGKWAETLGRGEPFHAAVYHAYFAEGRNIARPEVLEELAENAGLPTAEAREVLVTGRFTRAVEDDWARARSLGISAVPTVVYRNRSLVGFQPERAYRQLVEG